MSALILVDIQNDYFPGGRMPLANIEQAAENARQLLEHFRKTGQPTFHIQHTWDNPTAPFFVAGTPGAAIHESIAPQADEPVIVKHFANSFRGTTLLDELRRAAAAGTPFPLVLIDWMMPPCVLLTMPSGFTASPESIAATARFTATRPVVLSTESEARATLCGIGARMRLLFSLYGPICISR